MMKALLDPHSTLNLCRGAASLMDPLRGVNEHKRGHRSQSTLTDVSVYRDD